MDAATLEAFIPIVAIVCGVGFIPAIIFVIRYFRLKERELTLEAEAQRWAEKSYTALEMRVQRLETLLSLDQGKATEAQKLAQLEAGEPSGQATGLPQGAQPDKVR